MTRLRKMFLTFAAAVAMALASQAPTQADAAANPPLTEAQMVQMVNSFLTLSDAIDTTGAEGIEKVVALLHPDFRYEHREYGAHFDLAGLKEGYLARIERGWTRNSYSEITQFIAGENMLVIQKSSSWDDGRSGVWQNQHREGDVTLYEFTDGKISFIKEYWD